MAIHPITCSLGGKKKARNPQDTQTDKKKTCRTPHRQQPELRVETWTLELWGTTFPTAPLHHPPVHFMSNYSKQNHPHQRQHSSAVPTAFSKTLHWRASLMIDHIQCVTDSLIMLLLRCDLCCLPHGNEIVLCLERWENIKNCTIRNYNLIILLSMKQKS